jgi:heme exporter protein C
MIERIEKIILKVCPPILFGLLLVTLWAIFWWVPTDKGLGLSQRIFYYHMPAATTCFLAFAVAGLSSIAFLKSNRSIWDHAAHAGVGVGMIFATMVLVTGSIWARTAWGTWWTWDTRLTTFLVLWLLFATYLLLRAMGRGNDMTPRFAAVLAIVGAANVPLVMLATRLWRTIHPQVVRNREGGIDDPAMITTLILCLVAFSLLFAWLWALRVKMLRLEERTQILAAGSVGGAGGNW